VVVVGVAAVPVAVSVASGQEHQGEDIADSGHLNKKKTLLILFFLILCAREDWFAIALHGVAKSCVVVG